MKLARLIISGLIVAGAGASAVAGPVVADWQTFRFDWDGVGYGNSGHITALVELDLTQFTMVSTDNTRRISLSDPAVGNFSLTVTGPQSAGTYTKSDFQYLYFNSPAALDQTQNLFGQLLPNNALFGTGAPGSGSVGISGSAFLNYNAPVTMVLTNPSLRYLGLESVQNVSALAAVPEPETYAMLLAGMGLMAGMVRRKRKALAAR